MKAVLWTDYGPPNVLRIEKIARPIPNDNEVLIRIQATTVTAGDCELRSLKLPLFLGLPMRFYNGLRRPKRMRILGMEFSGEVVAIGKDVTRFQEGDRVFGTPGFGLGTYAEYRCIPEDGVIEKIPDGLTYEEAASIPVGGFESLHFLERANIKKGDEVLINGAGGSIGTFGIQLAKSYGAIVTAVDKGSKLNMLRSIGADHFIDYKKEDFTKNGRSYDVIFDVVGKGSYGRYLGSLNKEGVLLLANPKPGWLLRSRLTSMISSKKVIVGSPEYTIKHLSKLRDLVKERKVRIVVDRTFPLEDIVKAHEYVERGDKKGNLVITID